MSKIHWSLSNFPQRSITIYINSEQKVIAEDNTHFESILQALKDKADSDTIIELVDLATALNKHCRGLFEVKNGHVYIGDEIVPETLSNKIIDFYDEGIEVEPLVRFWQCLSLNPSFSSRKQLYRYVDANKVPIVDAGEKVVFKTSDGEQEVDCSGFFVAWKSVRSDFKDHHSGNFDNSPGQIVEMERRLVDDDPNVSCSSGLHVASWIYAANFMSGQKYVKVYVNPADVVSVPYYYKDSKIRTCKYYVVEEIDPINVPTEESKLVQSSYSYEDNLDDLDDDYYDDYDDYD